MPQIADALSRHEADVLVLSEYRGGEAAVRLLAALATLGYRHATPLAPPQGRSGVLIAARCAFRDHGAFHEDCTVTIARRIVDTLTPKWLRIGGYWYPRGGIPIDIFYQTSEPPAGLWLPDPGVAPYRGRG